jgi:hypothetical protein
VYTVFCFLCAVCSILCDLCALWRVLSWICYIRLCGSVAHLFCTIFPQVEHMRLMCAELAKGKEQDAINSRERIRQLQYVCCVLCVLLLCTVLICAFAAVFCFVNSALSFALCAFRFMLCVSCRQCRSLCALMMCACVGKELAPLQTGTSKVYRGTQSAH